MAIGALLPMVRWLITDNGVASPGAKAYFYASGTSTPQPVFSDAALTVPHAHPVVADAEGVLPVIFLSAVSYRVYVTNAAGTPIFPAQDDIYDVAQLAAASGSDANVIGTAGVSLVAGDEVYLSDGSGSLTAGRWYKADADFTYASTLPTIGMVVAPIASGSSGLIRLIGRVTGLSGLTAGTTYYVSATAGAITSTAPANARVVGVADSTTSIVLGAPTSQAQLVDVSRADGRLTLTTGVPITTGDVSAATSAFWCPYLGNRIALANSAGSWSLLTFSQLTLSLAGLTASKPYDVFGYNNAGVLALETLAWTNDTTRATALTTQDGVQVKSGDITRRWLATVYINASGGQTDDTRAKRYVYNCDHPVDRPVGVTEPANSWNYTTATFRQANNNAANQVEVMVGVIGSVLELALLAHANNSTGGIGVQGAIGEDSVTVACPNSIISEQTLASAFIVPVPARLAHAPAVGRHYYAWLERSAATGTTTWYGDNNTPTVFQSGMAGRWRC